MLRATSPKNWAKITEVSTIRSMPLLSGTWYSKNGKNLAQGIVLKRSGVDRTDRIRADNIGLVFYDKDNNWSMEDGDILLGSLVYSSSDAKDSGVFNQDPENPSSFYFGADTSDQAKGLMVIFNDRFLKGLPLDQPPPVTPQPVKVDTSTTKALLEATLNTESDIRDYVAANLSPTDTVTSSTDSIDLSPDSKPNIILTGSEDIGASGNSSDNVLVGNDGGNSLNGGSGDDVLIGGNGDDSYYIDSVNDVAIEMENGGSDAVYSSISLILPGMIEDLTLLESAAAGNGNTQNNKITGNDSPNALYGLAGDDTLDGGKGNDKLVGGLGNDTYIIDSISDKIRERLNGGNDTALIGVNGSGIYNLPKNVENASLDEGVLLILNGNDLANRLTGNSLGNILRGMPGDDYLSGLDGADRLIGGLGNDTLDGGGGGDTLAGGRGNDYYVVSDETDKVQELLGQGQDIVMADCDCNLSENVETLVLTGSRDTSGVGNSLNNHIKGNVGNNTLAGGAGLDTLTGLAGCDTFVLSFIGTQVDHVTDFRPGEDKIGFDKPASADPFTDGVTFSAVSGDIALKTELSSSKMIIYDSGTGFLYWNQNGEDEGFGSGGAFAILDNMPAIQGTDFILY